LLGGDVTDVAAMLVKTPAKKIKICGRCPVTWGGEVV
jgi:hypothetical protein